MTATRPPPKAVSSDEYARTALRVAVCQLAEAAGYGSARASAADALADVTARYAVALGRSAKGYAEAAGRGAANVADVVSGEGGEGRRNGQTDPTHSHSHPPTTTAHDAGRCRRVRRRLEDVHRGRRELLDVSEREPFDALLPFDHHPPNSQPPGRSPLCPRAALLPRAPVTPPPALV